MVSPAAYRPGITAPSALMTRLSVSTLSPPNVKQFPQMIGKARNGGLSIGRDQLDLRGTKPGLVASPSVSSGFKAPSGPAAVLAGILAAIVAASSRASIPTLAASSGSELAEIGGWSERTERFQFGTSSSLESRMT